VDMAQDSATHLLKEAKELVSLIEPGNSALVEAGVIALANKAASLEDRGTQREIEHLLRSAICKARR